MVHCCLVQIKGFGGDVAAVTRVSVIDGQPKINRIVAATDLPPAMLSVIGNPLRRIVLVTHDFGSVQDAL